MEQNICPVDVISMCSASGEIRPLRLRMEDEAHQLLRIDIGRSSAVKKFSMWGLKPTSFSAGLRYDRKSGCLN